MDLFPSLCLLSWCPCSLFGCAFLWGTCCHWHGWDAKTAFLHFNTLHTFFSLTLSPWELFPSPFRRLVRMLFLQEMPLRHIHIKRNHRIMNKMRNISQWCLLHKKNSCAGDHFNIMYPFECILHFPSELLPSFWCLLSCRRVGLASCTGHSIECLCSTFLSHVLRHERQTLSCFCGLTSLQKDLYHAD